MVSISRKLEPIRPPNFILFSDTTGPDHDDEPTQCIAVEELPEEVVRELVEDFGTAMLLKWHRATKEQKDKRYA